MKKQYKYFIFIILVITILHSIQPVKNHIKKLQVNNEISSILSQISQDNVVKGIEEAKKHKVVFVGIARDNAQDLKILRQDVDKIGKYFKDYKGIFFENDSKDKTKQILKEWSQDNKNMKIISQDFHNKKRPNILFLANAHNQYLNELMLNPEYKDFNIVIALDMDMKYGFDFRGIMDSMSKFNQWDAVCANGLQSKDSMYDAFAFRNKQFPHTRFNVPEGENVCWNKIVPQIQKLYYPVNHDLVPVFSCFNGLAIYKKDALENCKYDSIKEDCEHVLLHDCMRKKNNAKIFLNPSMVVFYSHYTPSTNKP